MAPIDPAFEPAVHRADANGLIASHGNLIVSVLWARTTAEHVDALRTRTAAVINEHDTFLSGVVVTQARTSDAPDAATRRSLSELIAETEATGLGTAFIVTADGFVGSAIVALLSGLFLIARSKEPSAAFRTIEPAAAWLDARARDGARAWRTGEMTSVLRRMYEIGESARASYG